MTVTAAGSGTQTSVIGTEHTLLDISVAGTYTFHLDANVMAAGDVVELRIYQMVLTGGTRRVAYLARFMDVQPTDDKIKLSVPVSNELTDAGALRFTLKQTAGTVHAYPWKVLTY
ncbi:MAG: hypothetical protein ACJ780_09955 [Solirubrobacteraceae bacterium]|jgi:hypothetical protein